MMQYTSGSIGMQQLNIPSIFIVNGAFLSLVTSDREDG